MRSFLILVVCLAALAGGAGLAVIAAGHLPEIAQLWSTGSAVYGTVAVQSVPVAAPSADNGGQKTPEPLPAPAPANVLTPLAAMLKDKLVDSTGKAVPTPGADVKYYAIYYSASWCPPCHAFTPTLVDWYRTFKPKHPDFELIFVSEDQSESSMFGYMTEMQMPWPAVKYAELPRTNGTFRGPDIQQFANSGIPDLVLVDSSGKVLADSFNGSSYLGPQSVITYMNGNL